MERLLHASGAGLAAHPLSARYPASQLRRLLADRREDILRVAERHKTSNVRVFGSVARGEDSERSEVDLLVDLAPDGSLLDQVRLRRELSRLLGVEVDVITSGGLLERDRKAIVQEAVPL